MCFPPLIYKRIFDVQFEPASRKPSRKRKKTLSTKKMWTNINARKKEKRQEVFSRNKIDGVLVSRIHLKKINAGWHTFNRRLLGSCQLKSQLNRN